MKKLLPIVLLLAAIIAPLSARQYAPFPVDQGKYGTCTAWASAYAARTIAESITLKRQARVINSGSGF